MTDLNKIKNNFKPSDTVSVVVFRNGEEIPMKITLGEVTQ